ATAAEASPASPTSSPANVDSKLNKIVDDISGLTLLQAADLVTLLKSRLNIQEIAMPAPTTAPVANVSTEDITPPEEKPKEKTIFNVTLEKFDSVAKAKIIKEIKSIIPNINLVEAKKFVESVPRVVKENLPKEDAEKLKKTFTDLGATVTLS
ncbi:ribosomal protein L7/L12 C-terminal domain-containing protein, partial [Cantharellus anzutake]|uniref:ribosomal protein L7/L12 C-terminal domain-containing protein n=1 Tax=Cantharellus anzutake TaxID=1750568 RepID=UPI001906607A